MKDFLLAQNIIHFSMPARTSFIFIYLDLLLRIIKTGLWTLLAVAIDGSLGLFYFRIKTSNHIVELLSPMNFPSRIIISKAIYKYLIKELNAQSF